MRKLYPLLILIISCATNPYDAYEKIEIGADKSVLLDEVGSPLRKKHEDKKDIWTYRFYVNNEEIYRDIYIQNNKVTFKGETQHAIRTQIENKIEEGLKKPLPEPPIDLEKHKNPKKFVPVE